MKRRKIVGLVLLIGTVSYLLASLLSLYQNQRVKIEKGIEEAIKAYSDAEGVNVKELSKDFNVLLDEKLDISDMNKQVLKYEGSFERIENNVNNVSNEMATVEYNVDVLSQRIYEIEQRYNSYLNELVNVNIKNEEMIVNLTNHISELENEIEIMQEKIKILHEEDSAQQKNEEIIRNDIQMIQKQCEKFKEHIIELENNALHFRYDSETQILNIFGKQKDNIEE